LIDFENLASQGGKIVRISRSVAAPATALRMVREGDLVLLLKVHPPDPNFVEPTAWRRVDFLSEGRVVTEALNWSQHSVELVEEEP
jgi:hypothetical protein